VRSPSTRFTEGNRRERGLTVVELAIGLGLFLVFSLGSLRLGLTVSSAYRTGLQRAETEGSLHEASDKIAHLLRGTPLASITPANLALPDSSLQIDFAKAVDFGVGAVVWGNTQRIAREPAPEDPDDGLDNDGDGLVDEGIVVWTVDVGTANEERVVLVRSVPELSPGEVAGNGADDNANGLRDEGGLNFAFDGQLLFMELSVSGVDSAGQETTWTSRRTIALRNVGG